MATVGHCYYLNKVMKPGGLAILAKRAQTWLEAAAQHGLKIDALAARGVSGAAIAFGVSALAGIPVLVSRKDGSHSSRTVEGPGAAQEIKTYLIVDDLICSGATVHQIVSDVMYSTSMLQEPEGAKCAGILLYDETYRSTSFNLGYVRNEQLGASIAGFDFGSVPVWHLDFGGMIGGADIGRMQKRAEELDLLPRVHELEDDIAF